MNALIGKSSRDDRVTWVRREIDEYCIFTIILFLFIFHRVIRSNSLRLVIPVELHCSEVKTNALKLDCYYYLHIHLQYFNIK